MVPPRYRRRRSARRRRRSSRPMRRLQPGSVRRAASTPQRRSTAPSAAIDLIREHREGGEQFGVRGVDGRVDARSTAKSIQASASHPCSSQYPLDHGLYRYRCTCGPCAGGVHRAKQAGSPRRCRRSAVRPPRRRERTESRALCEPAAEVPTASPTAGPSFQSQTSEPSWSSAAASGSTVATRCAGSTRASGATPTPMNDCRSVRSIELVTADVEHRSRTIDGTARRSPNRRRPVSTRCRRGRGVARTRTRPGRTRRPSHRG